jgi:hypothetical protein
MGLQEEEVMRERMKKILVAMGLLGAVLVPTSGCFAHDYGYGADVYVGRPYAYRAPPPRYYGPGPRYYGPRYYQAPRYYGGHHHDHWRHDRHDHYDRHDRHDHHRRH